MLKNTNLLIAISGLVMVAGWYLIDGRYEYMRNDSLIYRIDRLTGDRCTGLAKSIYWSCGQ